jgi:hypothetical protein
MKMAAPISYEETLEMLRKRYKGFDLTVASLKSYADILRLVDEQFLPDELSCEELKNKVLELRGEVLAELESSELLFDWKSAKLQVLFKCGATNLFTTHELCLIRWMLRNTQCVPKEYLHHWKDRLQDDSRLVNIVGKLRENFHGQFQNFKYI